MKIKLFCLGLSFYIVMSIAQERDPFDNRMNSDKTMDSSEQSLQCTVSEITQLPNIDFNLLKFIGILVQGNHSTALFSDGEQVYLIKQGEWFSRQNWYLQQIKSNEILLQSCSGEQLASKIVRLRL